MMEIIENGKKLSLKNSGELEIVFIGCGNAFGYKLFNNNFIIIKGDTHILVDFGVTGPTALRASAGLDVSDINNVLITHSHADHIGGLEFLALYNRYISERVLNKPKLNMIISKEYQQILWDMSLRGGMEWNETSESQKKLSFTDYFQIFRPKIVQERPRTILTINFEGIDLELFTTNHIPDNAETNQEAFITYGLYVDNRLLITGDTKFDEDLINHYGDRSEYIFHDTSFGFNPVHASIQQLRTLPDKYKSKMLLMHYGDNWEEQNIDGFWGLVKQGSRYIFSGKND